MKIIQYSFLGLIVFILSIHTRICYTDFDDTLSEYRRMYTKVKCMMNGMYIKFPAFFTGVYSYSKKEEAEIAIQMILEETKEVEEDFEIRLVAFDAEKERLYQETMQTENRLFFRR